MRKLTNHRRISLFTALGLLCPLALWVIAYAPPSGSSHRSNELLNRPHLGPGNFETRPLSEGYFATEEQVQRVASYKLRKPQHPLANRNNITAWMTNGRPGAENVAVTFESGVVAILGEPQFDEPAVTFAAIVSQNPHMRVETIKGEPALVIPPRTDMVGGNRGSIQFHWRGVSITVYGPHDLSIQQVKEIAESFE